MSKKKKDGDMFVMIGKPCTQVGFPKRRDFLVGLRERLTLPGWTQGQVNSLGIFTEEGLFDIEGPGFSAVAVSSGQVGADEVLSGVQLFPLSL